MRYTILLVLTVLFSLLSPVAQGQVSSSGDDGNDLLPRCKAAVDGADSQTWKSPHEAFSTGYCWGLLQGITYGSPSLCPGKGVTTLQEARVVVKYLEDNPQNLNLSAAMLVESALSKAFPCSTK